MGWVMGLDHDRGLEYELRKSLSIWVFYISFLDLDEVHYITACYSRNISLCCCDTWTSPIALRHD